VQRDKFFATWSSLHGNAEIAGIVKAWLTISYRVVNPLNKLGVTPNLVTGIGLLAAIATWPTALTWWAPALLVLSLFCDGIDGSLAMISEKSSKRGAMIDSFVDRVSEAFWVLAFYRLGADLRVLLIVGVVAFTQEYMRARAAGVGQSDIGAVTIAERPVRASLLFIAFIAFQLKINLVSTISIVWLGAQLVSLVYLAKIYFTSLKSH
jgi:phosphatidylglycerophosphate synthase